MGVAKSIKKGVSKTGKAARKGASATGKVGRSVGNASRKGASATGRAAESVGTKVRKNASRASNATKSGGRKAAQFAASAGEIGLSVSKEAANRLAGLPEAGLNALGVLPSKKLRLRVVVLADADGKPVLPPRNGRSTKEQVLEAIDVARSIFKGEANVRIIAASGKLVQIDRTPAPEAALTVRCDGGALRDDLGSAGFFFRKRMARNAVGTAVGAGAPITAFIVKDVVGKAGCSLGPLTDYVTVDVSGIASGSKRTLAHELGHALGLPHTEGTGSAIAGESADNLMRSNKAGEKLNKRQVILIRNSRHVTLA